MIFDADAAPDPAAAKAAISEGITRGDARIIATDVRELTPLEAERLARILNRNKP